MTQIIPKNPKNDHFSSSRLGNTTDFASSQCLQGLEPVLDPKTGELVLFEFKNGQYQEVFDRQAFRAGKYALQSSIRDIMSRPFQVNGKDKKARVCSCLRSCISPDELVKIYKSKKFD